MKHNLLEIFDTEIKPDLFDELKKESPSIDNVNYQHLTIIHASILGGLIQKSKRPNGAKAIKSLIEKGNHDGAIFDRIPEIFGDDQKLSDTKKLGNSLLAFVFDDGTDKAFEKIQYFLSEKYLTSEEELIDVNRVVAPFSMGLIGRIVHQEEMQEEQIAELLSENEPIISKSFPGLARVLGMKAAPIQEPKEEAAAPSTSTVQPDTSDSGVEKEKVDTTVNNSSNEDEVDRKSFLKALWPWVAVLIVSGLSLFILNRFQGEPVETKPKNPFNFIQSDSLIQDSENSYTLPGNVYLKVDRYSTMDTLLSLLENNQGQIDTLRYLNSEIRFQDSSAVLTSSANKELSIILSILQSYPKLKMDINIFYDPDYLAQNIDITSMQIKNLKDYFSVFGLNSSRYNINRFQYPKVDVLNGPAMEDIAADTLIKNHTPELKKNQKVELLFYHDQLLEVDSLKTED